MRRPTATGRCCASAGRRASAIVRSAIYPTANRGFARRLLEPPVAVRRRRWPPRRPSGPADVVVVESPPLFLAGAGASATRRPSARRWSSTSPTAGRRARCSSARCRTAARSRPPRRLERWAYRRAAAVTVPTEGLARELGAEPAAAGRVTRLPPAVDSDALRRRGAARRAATGRCASSTRGPSGSRTASRRCSKPPGSRGRTSVRGDGRGRGRRGGPAGGDGARATCACSGSSRPRPCRSSTRRPTRAWCSCATGRSSPARCRPSCSSAWPPGGRRCCRRAARPPRCSSAAGAGLVGGARGPARARGGVPGAARRPGAARPLGAAGRAASARALRPARCRCARGRSCSRGWRQRARR